MLNKNQLKELRTLIAKNNHLLDTLTIDDKFRLFQSSRKLVEPETDLMKLSAAEFQNIKLMLKSFRTYLAKDIVDLVEFSENNESESKTTGYDS